MSNEFQAQAMTQCVEELTAKKSGIAAEKIRDCREGIQGLNLWRVNSIYISQINHC